MKVTENGWTSQIRSTSCSLRNKELLSSADKNISTIFNMMKGLVAHSGQNRMKKYYLQSIQQKDPSGRLSPKNF